MWSGAFEPCCVDDNPSRPPMPGLCEIAPGRWGAPKIRLVRTGGSRHRRCEGTGGGPHSDKRPPMHRLGGTSRAAWRQ